MQIISRIIDLSNTARKEGLLSLEEAAADLEADGEINARDVIAVMKTALAQLK